MAEERKINDDELVEISGGADGPNINIDENKKGPGELGRSDSEDPAPPGGPGAPPDEGPLGTDSGGGSGDVNLG